MEKLLVYKTFRKQAIFHASLCLRRLVLHLWPVFLRWARSIGEGQAIERDRFFIDPRDNACYPPHLRAPPVTVTILGGPHPNSYGALLTGMVRC